MAISFSLQSNSYRILLWLLPQITAANSTPTLRINLLTKAPETTWSFATSAVLYHNESYAIVDNTQQCTTK